MFCRRNPATCGLLSSVGGYCAYIFVDRQQPTVYRNTPHNNGTAFSQSRYTFLEPTSPFDSAPKAEPAAPAAYPTTLAPPRTTHVPHTLPSLENLVNLLHSSESNAAADISSVLLILTVVVLFPRCRQLLGPMLITPCLRLAQEPLSLLLASDSTKATFEVIKHGFNGLRPTPNEIAFVITHPTFLAAVIIFLGAIPIVYDRYPCELASESSDRGVVSSASVDPTITQSVELEQSKLATLLAGFETLRAVTNSRLSELDDKLRKVLSDKESLEKKLAVAVTEKTALEDQLGAFKTSLDDAATKARHDANAVLNRRVKVLEDEITAAKSETSTAVRAKQAAEAAGLAIIQEEKRATEKEIMSLKKQLDSQHTCLQRLEHRLSTAEHDKDIGRVDIKISQLDDCLTAQTGATERVERREAALEKDRDATNDSITTIDRAIASSSKVIEDQNIQLQMVKSACDTNGQGLVALTERVARAERLYDVLDTKQNVDTEAAAKRLDHHLERLEILDRTLKAHEHRITAQELDLQSVWEETEKRVTMKALNEFLDETFPVARGLHDDPVTHAGSSHDTQNDPASSQGTPPDGSLP